MAVTGSMMFERYCTNREANGVMAARLAASLRRLDRRSVATGNEVDCVDAIVLVVVALTAVGYFSAIAGLEIPAPLALGVNVQIENKISTHGCVFLPIGACEKTRQSVQAPVDSQPV